MSSSQQHFYFHLPSFTKREKDKVNTKIDLPSEHFLVSRGTRCSVPAISSRLTSTTTDGTHIFVAYLEAILSSATTTRSEDKAYIYIGFTSTKNYDSEANDMYPGARGLNGSGLFISDGRLFGGDGTQWSKEYFPSEITRNSKEIIAILTVSENGTRRSIQFVADGNEGPVVELKRSDFENRYGSDEIFAVVNFRDRDQKIQIIPFHEVKSRSSKIDQLMREFENDAVILQLRQELDVVRERTELLEAEARQQSQEMQRNAAEIIQLQNQLIIRQVMQQ